VPFLPLRLDRLSLRADPRRFAAQELQLPDSPARCLKALADERDAVLVVDQLDALRWTSSHSAEAWDVCREMMEEALATPGLKLVVCCRTFDLEHDPQLRSWEKQAQYLRRVAVDLLAEEDVGSSFGRCVGDSNAKLPVRPRELQLLRHVQHLQMWLAIIESRGTITSFDTSWGLLEQFWATRRDALTDSGITQERIEEIEHRLVEALDSGAVLSAAVRKLDMSAEELDRFQTLHLLQVDETRPPPVFSFAHQSYQDFLVAKHLLQRLDRGSSRDTENEIRSWLGSRESQSLFRREQLRLVLTALRAEEHAAYLPVLKSLVPPRLPKGPSRIRFHLRLLALQFLSQQDELLAAEKEHVLELVDQPAWREHVLEEMVRGRVPWFEALDDAGKFESWLAGDDEDLQNKALEMLSYAVETSGDRVARLLRPYVGEDEKWINRAVWALRFDPSKDSDALFELRIDLAKRGAYLGDHIEWGELAKRPARFVVLMVVLLRVLAKDLKLGNERRRPGMRSQLDWHTLDTVTADLIDRERWGVVWRCLFRSVARLARIDRFEVENRRTLETYAVDFETLSPVLRLLRKLGKAMLSASWRDFVGLGERLTQEDYRHEVLFLESLSQGPLDEDLADWVLGWLMEDPWRVRLRLRRGAGEWALSARLIERFAPISSDEIFSRFEEWLLDYVEPDLLERYRSRHKRVEEQGDLAPPSRFGRTPHVLLSYLPLDRTSSRVATRLRELPRKFGQPRPSDTAEGERDQAGFGSSPLDQHAAERMSDQAWLKLASSEKLQRGRGRLRWKEDGRYEEASVQTISADFRQGAQREPERFARLLARWPVNGERIFVKAILSGLEYPGDRKKQQSAEEWQPPTHQVLEEVLQIPAAVALAREEDDTEVAGALCGILERYAEYPWSEQALDLLVWIAQNHRDPSSQTERLEISGAKMSLSWTLMQRALNVTRGKAGYAIRALLFKHPEFFQQLHPAVESLAVDDHPAVRVTAVAACLPVINIDRDLAVDCFLEAIKGPEAVLATDAVERFMRYTYRTHLVRLLPTIDRMTVSGTAEVAKMGARFASAAYLVDGEVRERFEECVGGTPAQRKGVAEVAASLLGKDEFAEQARTTLLRLADDEDEEVARVVARSFEKLDLKYIAKDREAWRHFAQSKAFQADPTYLLQALEKQSGDLSPFAECLLAAGTTFAEELAERARDRSQTIAMDAQRYLLPLLLRLYEQTKERDLQTNLRCLDLWDRLLERRVGSVMGLTRELDRM